jgi:hypothetical protein
MNARPDRRDPRRPVNGRIRRLASGGIIVAALAAAPSAIRLEVLQSAGAVPAHLAGRFREPIGFQQSTDGQYFVFDRRAHTVYGMDERQTSVWTIVTIGAEEGRIIDPTAFAVGPDGSFVVADAPNNRERIQVFSAAGLRLGGFLLPGRLRTRVTLQNAVLNGIGTLQYTGRSILISQPETGALVAEYTLQGAVSRLIGSLRATGHESEYDLHVALNSGIPLVDPSGGCYFVFQAGEPAFRKYDRTGALIFERRVEGREIDPLVASLPTGWPRRRTADGELPVVSPTIRAAAVDAAGNLWLAFVTPHVYVYDADGDKIRALQLRASGVFAPSQLFFGKGGRLLTTPGLFEFSIP